MRTHLALCTVLVAAAASSDAVTQATRWIGGFGQTGGWMVGRHPRVMADVNGDGRDDIVAFGDNGVAVSLSTGSAFAAPVRWVANYGYDASAGGWRVDLHPRFLADVNKDGRADVVGFGGPGVYVSLSTGSSFTAPALWSSGFGYNDGWRVDQHPRMLGDINGDGRADVVGFATTGVWLALSTGSAFATPVHALTTFGTNAGWVVDRHPRMLADVNGDKADDIIAFGNSGAEVALSTYTGFATPKIWVANYSYNAGWRTDRHPRFVADVNKDGWADVIGCGNPGVYVSLSTGSSFAAAALWVAGYGYDNAAGAWRVDQHPRMVADINGDGRTDLVGFGNDGGNVSLSSGSSFGAVLPWTCDFGANDGWLVAQHPRMTGDADGDGRADIVGFDSDGVYVHTGWESSMTGYGASCSGILSGSIGFTSCDVRAVEYTASNLPALHAHVFVLGLSKLDVPLQGSCRLYAFPDFVLLASSVSGNTAKLALPVPASVRAPFYAQFVGLRASSSVTLVSTAGLETRL